VIGVSTVIVGFQLARPYNQSLTPVEAIERLRRLDDEQLTWVEEPTLAHDFIGHAAIAQAARTPIQCGENWWGTLDFRNAVAHGASDLIMPDVMKVGGVSGWLRVAAMAKAQNIPVANHLWPEISAQLMCLTPTAHWLEYCDWWNPVIAEPVKVEKGEVHITDASGIGVAWDEDAVSRLLV